jgi:hypothetical protein
MKKESKKKIHKIINVTMALVLLASIAVPMILVVMDMFNQ